MLSNQSPFKILELRRGALTIEEDGIWNIASVNQSTRVLSAKTTQLYDKYPPKEAVDAPNDHVDTTEG